nr:ornithine aminomutase subunit alpha [Tissierella sp.]
MEREDDFQSRRKHLNDLSEKELEARFWSLSEKLVDPLITLAHSHSSPSIERSVLLRMGFSSIEAKKIVDIAIERNIVAKGAGNLVYRLAQAENISIRDAGLHLYREEMWENVISLF